MAKKEKAVIEVFNQKSKINCHLKYILALRKTIRLKANGYFFSPAYRSGQWDGYIKYVTEGGQFDTGLLDEVISALTTLGLEVSLVDRRSSFKPKYDIETLQGLKFRDYQLESLQSVLNNKMFGISYPRGILYEATNSGKTLIAAGIYASYHTKRNGLFLVNNKELFLQSLADIEALLPGEVGYVSSEKGVKIKRINVCMVQTLGLRMKSNPQLRAMVSNTDIIIVDEADEVINRKDCQSILKFAHNAIVRIALSGTALSTKPKMRTRNKSILSYFGPVLHRTTNKELVDKGFSTKPDIRIYTGNKSLKYDDYAEEYEKAIMRNKARHKRIWKLVQKFDEKKRGPFLILFKYHTHGENLMLSCPKELRDIHNVEMVHHKTSNRTQILKRFNEGKIHILVCSFIIKRGKNLPLIKTLINAAGGDSEANVLQIFGRLLRSHKSKKKAYMVDLFDEGKYLKRHSKHRITYYKNEKFKVAELYKK